MILPEDDAGCYWCDDQSLATQSGTAILSNVQLPLPWSTSLLPLVHTFLNLLRVTLPAWSIQLLADHWYRGNLALEWGEFGIRCNCVAPGPIADTPGLEKLSVLVAHSRTLDVWNMYPHWLYLNKTTMVNISHTCLAYGIADNKCLTTHHFSGAQGGGKADQISWDHIPARRGGVWWGYHGLIMAKLFRDHLTAVSAKTMRKPWDLACQQDVSPCSQGAQWEFMLKQGAPRMSCSGLFEANSHDFAPQWLWHLVRERWSRPNFAQCHPVYFIYNIQFIVYYIYNLYIYI